MFNKPEDIAKVNTELDKLLALANAKKVSNFMKLVKCFAVSLIFVNLLL